MWCKIKLYLCKLQKFMRQFLVYGFMVFSSLATFSQTYEMGVFVGGSNVIGDVGPTNYINPNSFAIGGVIKWDKSTRYDFRASLIYTKLRADDANSDLPSRVERGFNIQAKMLEASLGMEFNFFDFNLHNFSKPATPYIYGGISVFAHDKIFIRNGESDDYGNRITFGIPMGVGVKAKLAQHVIVGFEVGARYTFTDNLDGSNPIKELADREDLKFGNIFSDDWYVFTGITITYSFGRKPCYSCY